VFAQVVEGLEVMNEIAGVPTGSFGFHQDVPKEPVFIVRVSVED
jgi:cyclophilin family peptidyl-prolyl cis-trans isomerase